MIRLIVGLGNPGKKYLKTRHNAGFLLLDYLAEEMGGNFSPESRFFGDLAIVGSNKVYLLKPNTFMNRSGQSVSSVARYYKIKQEEILVIHDELDFEVGVVKLKFDGGHGGHNGIRDIKAGLGGGNFGRLRVGIGRPIAGSSVSDYVLSDFSKKETQGITAVFLEFLECLPLLFQGERAKAVHVLHGKNN